MKKLTIIVIVVVVAIAIGVYYVFSSEKPKLLSFETAAISPSEIIIGQVATITVNVKNISDKPINNITIETIPKYSKDGEYVLVNNKSVSLLPIDKGGTSGPKPIAVTAINPGIKEGIETLIVTVKINGVEEINKEFDLLIKR